MQKNKYNWIWVGILILIPFILFGRHLFFGGYIGDLGDDLVQNLPNKFILFEYLINGEFPLWNPYIFMGFPLLADIQVGALYLPNILSFALFDHFIQSYNFLAVLHLVIAQVGMYLFLREEGFKRPSAFIGAFAFAFSGAVMRKLPFINMVEIIALVPLFLYVLLRFVKKPKFLWIALGSLIFAFMVFAGHPPSIGYFLIIGVTYLVAHYLFHRKINVIYGFLLMIAIGVLLSAVQILPFLNLIQQSARSGIELAEFYQGSMSFTGIFKGLTTWEYGSLDYSHYGGFIPLIALALLIWPIKQKETFKHFRLWIFLLLFFSVFFMLGENNPLYQLVHKVPFFGNIRVPGRYGIIFNVGMAISFAVVINWLLAKKKKVINILVIILSLLVIVDLGYYTMRSLPFNPVEKANNILYSESLDTLRSHMQDDNDGLGNARVLTSNTIPTNTNYVHGVEYIHGYNPIVLQDYKTMFITDTFYNESPLKIFENNKLFSLFNLKYYVLPKTDDVKEGLEKFDASLDFTLYKNTNYTDRIYSPERIFYVKSLAQARGTIFNDDFDIKKDATVQTEDSDKAVEILKPLEISEIQYDLQGIQLEVESDEMGFLIVNDTYYPEWKAYIDGEKTEIIKTNGLVRGIFVPEGRHTVIFAYQPVYFYVGLVVSLVTFLLMLVIVGFWDRKLFGK
ncbi:YfhO family protein [Patescibacteria group bacterium]